jgi:hypothetical protein
VRSSAGRRLRGNGSGRRRRAWEGGGSWTRGRYAHEQEGLKEGVDVGIAVSGPHAVCDAVGAVYLSL